jgi:hypothetical protein
VLGRRAELDPLITEAAPDPVRDHRIQHSASRLVAHAVPELAAGADVLDRRQVATFVVDTRQAVAHELLRDVGDAVALALRPLLGRERRTLTHTVEYFARAIRHTAIQVAARVAVEGAAGWVRRVLRDLRHLERLGVVERRVPAAVLHHDRVLC